MRSALLLLFAASCACLAAASCENNPALYTLGIVPKSGSPYADAIQTLNCTTNHDSSCCTEEITMQIQQYIKNFDDFTGMFDDLISGINNVNRGLLNNFPTLISIVQLAMPMLSGVFPECTTVMKPGACGDDIIQGLSNEECLQPYLRTLVTEAVTNGLPQLGGILYYLYQQWPTFEAIVKAVEVQLQDYVHALACHACNSNLEARKAAGNMFYVETNDEALVNLRRLIDMLHDQFIDAVETIGGILIQILDKAHSSCAIDGRSPGYFIESILGIIQIPSQELWKVASYEISTYLNTIITMVGTITPTVAVEYDVTPQMLTSFKDWTEKCSDGMLYLIVNMLTDMDLSSLGVDLSQYKSLITMIADMFSHEEIDVDYCLGRKESGSTVFLTWINTLISIITASELQLPQKMPWLQPDAVAFARQQKSMMNPDIKIKDIVSPWALQEDVDDETLKKGTPTGWIPVVSVNQVRKPEQSSVLLDFHCIESHPVDEEELKRDVQKFEFDDGAGQLTGPDLGSNVNSTGNGNKLMSTTTEPTPFLKQFTSDIILPYFITACVLLGVAVVFSIAGGIWSAKHKKNQS